MPDSSFCCGPLSPVIAGTTVLWVLGADKHNIGQCACVLPARVPVGAGSMGLG